MAIPSGSGTEILKRLGGDNIVADSKIDWASAITATGNTAGTVGVPANHIITILNISIFNNSGTARSISLWIDIAGNTSHTIQIWSEVLPGDSTFIWNDKFVLHPADVVHIYSSGDCAWHFSYIEQNWS